MNHIEPRQLATATNRIRAGRYGIVLSVVVLAGVASAGSSCNRAAPPPTVAPTAATSTAATSPAMASTTTPWPLAPDRTLSPLRWMLAGYQAKYLEKEGVRNRGPEFERLISALSEISKKDSPVDERELLEVTGPPDYESRRAGYGVMYIYLFTRKAKNDTVAYVECYVTPSPLRVTWGDANQFPAQHYTPFKSWPERRMP